MEIAIKLKDLVESSREYMQIIQDMIKDLQLNKAEDVLKKIPVIEQSGDMIRSLQKELISFCETKYSEKIQNFTLFLNKNFPTEIRMQEMNREFIDLLKSAQQKIELILIELRTRKEQISSDLKKLSANKDLLSAYSLGRHSNIFDKKG